MSSDDPYAENRPQRLQNPYRLVGWAMVLRGLIFVAFGFYAIAAIAPALRAGQFTVVATLLVFGFGFISWGAKAISQGAAIGLRFGVRQYAPADLADRLDPHTGEAIGYGQRAYDLQNLRHFFLRKELPHKVDDDLIDQILSIVGHANQPLHPTKRDLIVDVLRGAIASAALLAAFLAAFGFVQFDPGLRNQQSLMNLVFLLAFIFVLKYWGLTKESHKARRGLSLSNLLLQMALVTLVAVVLPIALSMFSPLSAPFSRVEIPSPFGLLTLLVSLGAVAVAAILAFAVIQSKRPIYSGEPTLMISEMAPVEAYGRLLPKDLLNAFARFIGTSRALSLDDRVYAFSETLGQGYENQPSDHAEYIAESSPLLRTNLLPSGAMRVTLTAIALAGETLLLVSAFVLFAALTGYTELVRQAVSSIAVGNFAGVLRIVSHPLTISALYVAVLARFGTLFREIGLRFLGEVIFQSLMVAISISSSVLPGRAEVSRHSSGTHFFDAGRSSILRIRIQSARVQTSTMVSRGGGADSLGAPRYVIAAEREERLLDALGQVASKYIEERTTAAATKVQSTTVEAKDVAQLLVDSSSRAYLTGTSEAARLSQYRLDGIDPESPRRLTDETER